MNAWELFERINARETDAVIAAVRADPKLARLRHRGLGSTPLHFAAHRGLSEIVDALLAAGAEVEARETASDSTALHWAAEGGHAAVAQSLIDHGASLDPRDGWHDLTPLGWATVVEWAPRFRADRPATVRVLLDGGATVDAFAALGLGRWQDLERMVAEDARVLERRLGFVSQEMSLLHLAAARGDVEGTKRLLDLGADVGALTQWGLTPLAISIRAGKDAVATLLRQRGAPEDPSVAVISGDAAVLRSRLDALSPSDERDVAQRLLYLAAASGAAELIEPLLAAGADPTRPTRHLLGEMPGDVSALHLAAQAGAGGVVSALLSAGVDVDPGVGRGAPTPLHVAAMGGHVEVVRALLAAGADTEAREECFQSTPLGWAEFGGHAEVIALLRA